MDEIYFDIILGNIIQIKVFSVFIKLYFTFLLQIN